MKLHFSILFILINGILPAQGMIGGGASDTIPGDLPLPRVTLSKSPSPGFLFAAVPYWGTGNSYLVMYDNAGSVAAFKRTQSTPTDFKLHENGLMTYFDYGSKKFFALNHKLQVVDSFWVQNGYTTDEHDLRFLPNGNVLLIGTTIRFYDMRQYISGGDLNASVVVNCIQELDRSRRVVFEWRAYEHYKITDAGPAVNLLDQAFVHTHLNSIDIDLDNNLIISSRNLNEVTKIDRQSGRILWRLGGKNNQFTFINDSAGFSAQHSASVLPNGNLLVYDNGLFHQPHYSRAVEYKLDTVKKTATKGWSYRRSPDIASRFWGHAQRLSNGNTLIAWGMAETAVTEVTSAGEPVFEMTFPAAVYSYRIFRFPFSVTKAEPFEAAPPGPSDYLLVQNYPNPFNPQTTIQYQLPVDSHVRIEVFNQRGQIIARLVDGNKADGNYSVVWKSLEPSGIYFCRINALPLTTGKMKYSKTIKLLLLK